jgi:uncharacterized protein YfbU (UPF0304 family)
MELSEKDRLIIANQLKILEKLYPEEAEYYAQHRKAIEHGYRLHYDWLTEHFYEEMTEEECKEVLDILEMYRIITFSFQKLSDKKGVDERRLRFQGFDGNEEGRQFSYALYFIVDLGRFDELRYGAQYPDLNSHAPMLDQYRRMLTVWHSFDNRFELNKAQLCQVLEA